MKKDVFDIINSGISVTRRSLLKLSGAAAAALVFGVEKAKAAVKWLSPRSVQKSAATTLDKAVRVVHSVCLGCNARCGNRAVVENGKLVKVSGNPYHPFNNHLNPIKYDTPLKDTLGMSVPVCGKAQDVPNYVYNPYRILKPLKRAGKRGSGKFEPIEWEQMIREISEGGKLFSHLGENRTVPGMKDLNSDAPIDPGAPELGPKRNGFVLMTGRLQPGRKHIIDRFTKDAMGSPNRVGHTDICGIGFRMGNRTMVDYEKMYEMKADVPNAEYILVFGANIYEALQPGVNTYGAMTAKRFSEGKLKFTIVDPRATNASTHAEDWIAIKPGHDGALAMGMIRWMIENNRYNREFLTAPNPKAADSKGYSCYSNATHLVIVDPSHKNDRKFLRIADLDPSASEEKGKAFVVLSVKDGYPVSFDMVDDAILDQETSVRDASGKHIKVKTSYRLMKEGVMEYTLDEYAEIGGIKRSQIENVAREFTSHGTKAAVTQYHGAGNYAAPTHGSSYPVALLNAMIGSVNRKGGYVKSSGGAAKWNKGQYDLKSFPGKKKKKGAEISRIKTAYETTTEYRKKKAAGGSGYPSKLPWFPYSYGGLSVETLNAIDAKYPYPCEILFTYFYDPIYSTPGGYRYKETFADPDRTPLHVSIDVTVNETNIYADYIVPDVTYPEGHYGWLGVHPPSPKMTGVRTPLIEPLTGKTADGRHFSLDTFLIDVAEATGLPGFGKNAIAGKDGRMHPFHKTEDYFLRGIANMAYDAKVPEASPEEVSFVEKNYPVAKHKDMLSKEEWRKTCYVLARGGVFKKYDDVFDGEKHKYGVKRVVLYNEDMAMTRNSLTGELFPGTVKFAAPADSAGNNIEKVDRNYPFYVITHKMNLHTQSRTVWHRWSMEVFPENFVVVNEKDAAALGVKSKDKVRLVSRSNPEGVVGKVQVSKLIRPGCIGISNHYGHKQNGASHVPIVNAKDVFLGGEKVADKNGLIPDPTLGTGISSNRIARLDENLFNTPLGDVLGGVPDFSSTKVKIVKL